MNPELPSAGSIEGAPRASGALIAKERAVLEGIVGAEVVVRALDRLPPALRSEYEDITALTKIPTSTVEAVYHAVAQETGRDVYRLHREIVRGGVEQAMKTIWRVLLKFTSDQAIGA